MSELISKKIPYTISYQAYIDLVAELVESGSTTGPNQTESLIQYTQLNQRRMNRVFKQFHLTPGLETALTTLKQAYLWIVITESWCGDAAQIVPVLAGIAASSPHLELRIILRDEHPDLMDAFMANGTRSIPRLICVDAETYEEVGDWGPRPEMAQQLVMAHKANPKVPYEEFSGQLQQWYNKDKSLSTQQEIKTFIESWA